MDVTRPTQRRQTVGDLTTAHQRRIQFRVSSVFNPWLLYLFASSPCPPCLCSEPRFVSRIPQSAFRSPHSLGWPFPKLEFGHPVCYNQTRQNKGIEKSRLGVLYHCPLVGRRVTASDRARSRTTFRPRAFLFQICDFRFRISDSKGVVKKRAAAVLRTAGTPFERIEIPFDFRTRQGTPYKARPKTLVFPNKSPAPTTANSQFSFCILQITNHKIQLTNQTPGSNPC